jgi:polar amino acid transport system permease protein
VTVEVAILGGFVMVIASLTVGLASLTPSTAVRAVVRTYVEIARGTSAIVQMYFAFFVLPLLGVTLSPLLVGVLVLGLNFGAFGSEVVRAAIQRVDRAQREAAIALNMPPALAMRRVILPQALIGMVPPLANLEIELLKATSLLSLITFTELTRTGAFLFSVTGRSLDLYLLILVIYFVVAVVMSFMFRRVERWITRDGLLIGRR